MMLFQQTLYTPLRLAIFWLDSLHRLLGTTGHFDDRRDKEEPSLREAHRILQVAEEACPEVIKAAYRALAMKHHPDRGGSVEMMKRLNDAYARLIKEHGG